MAVDTIGQGGVQLFVDIGRPIDSALVDALLKEVLTEKIVAMLGQRPAPRSEPGTAAAGRSAAVDLARDDFLEPVVCCSNLSICN